MDLLNWCRTTVKERMFHDIDACIDKQVDFVVALALSSYTEVLGGIVNGTLTNIPDNKTNYLSFLSRMKYSPEECEKYYYLVRCGLVHQYFVKNKSQIGNDIGNKRGIEVHDGYIYFDTRKYYNELREAFDEYLTQLKDDIALQTKLSQIFANNTVPDSSVVVSSDGSNISTQSPKSIS